MTCSESLLYAVRANGGTGCAANRTYRLTDFLKILNEKLETFFNKTYLPKIILIENDGLGEEGTITNALEIFYSKD